MGDKRGVLRFALRELHRAAPEPVDVIALPAHAPFGAVEIDTAGCTLCLSCVAACPTGALTDDPQRPMLRFTEEACVQCGLCQATCPEKVITLKPRLDFRAGSGGARVLKEEQPFCCIRCRKPFGVKSTIERVVAKLADQALDVQGVSRAPRSHQNVRRLPRRLRLGEGIRSLCERRAHPCERPTIICASAMQSKAAEKSDGG